MDRIWRFALGIIFLGFLGWGLATPLYAHPLAESAASPSAVALPSNFIVRTVASGFTLPTDMVIMPSGDFLVTEKGIGAGEFSKAQVRFVRQGVLQPTPVLTLGVNTQEDSGLLGIVLDPQFDSNRYFYLWYTTGEDSLLWTGTSYNRLSRFVFNPATGLADPASETIILDRVTWTVIHSGGGLIFDNQGNLFITTGDASTDANFPTQNLAQSPQSLNGKVLRIRPREEGGYDVPSDNPYVNNSQGFRPEIFASGLRNPFRIARRAANHGFYLIDVGQDTWEEIDQVSAGANYGWPYREGNCAIYERGPDCSPTPPEYTEPVLSYIHPEGMGAGITAIAFYEGNEWPPEYQGRVYFADFDLDWVGMANLDDPSGTITQFATGLGGVVDMEATASGIYVLSIYEQSIKFIYYDVESNLPPTALLAATPVSGTAPLEVNFTATATDANGDDLYYLWKFGDGIQVTTEIPTITHVYTQDGDYLATLQVIDEDDGQSEIRSQLIQVYSGARSTIVQENLTFAGRTLYNGGDEILFRAEREGGTAGLDPTKPFAWTILLRHNEHAHILLAEYGSSEVLLEIPVTSHSLGAPLWYEVRLATRTANGQILRTTRDLLPETTTIQAQSWPGTAVITLDQQVRDPDELTSVVVGQQHTLQAPQRMIYDGKVGQFKNWVVTESWPAVSTAGETEIVPERTYTVVISAKALTYVAFYEYLQPATLSFMPTVRR